MVATRRPRCKAGFIVKDTEQVWNPPDRFFYKIPEDFDQCVRQAGHPERHGHILQEGGAYDNAGVLKYHNRVRKFEALTEDWIEGLELWVDEEYLKEIKKEISEMQK